MIRRLRRWAFNALYYQFAWAYDWISRTFFRGQWWLWQQAPMPHLKGHQILELGPGTGRLLLEMLRDGYSVIGLELSAPMLRLTTKRLTKFAHPDERARALLLQGNSNAIPLIASSIDTIVSTFPTDYILAPVTLAEAMRVLRPAGRLIIVPTAQLTKRELLEAAVVRAAYGKQASPSPFEQLDDRLVEAGFKVHTKVWSNKHGWAMIVIADKPISPQH